MSPTNLIKFPVNQLSAIHEEQEPKTSNIFSIKSSFFDTEFSRIFKLWDTKHP